MFALDSNAVIHALKGKGGVAERLLAVPPPDQIVIPAVALYEIQASMAGSPQGSYRRRSFEALLGAVTIAPFDRAAVDAATDIRLDLMQRGQLMGPMDILIAPRRSPGISFSSPTTRANSAPSPDSG